MIGIDKKMYVNKHINKHFQKKMCELINIIEVDFCTVHLF